MFFQKKKLAKHCAVYISERHDQIIITPQHINEAGILFEQEYIRISIGGCNEHNLLFNMEGAPYKNSELKIKTTMSFHADPAEIGNRILKVYHACLNGHL